MFVMLTQFLRVDSKGGEEVNNANNLVSVERQSEYSITEGKTETRIFVKMYVSAVRDGLIADNYRVNEMVTQLRNHFFA